MTLYEMQGFDHGQVLGPACYQIADYVKGLLSNQDLCQKIADAGYRSCVNIHSWQERTKKIIDIFEQMREVSL